ncbi:MAG: hypothetical protein OXF88_00405 [Rhodobacteraceae bacterium]|nr:hypothetical protein [Paracoccaceae bacterium]
MHDEGLPGVYPIVRRPEIPAASVNGDPVSTLDLSARDHVERCGL